MSDATITAGEGADTAPSTMPAAGRIAPIELRGPSALDLLKLGETIVRLQAGLRELRLEKEDLRFERDRYRASAARTQERLTQALDELDQIRAFREDALRLRQEFAGICAEFEHKIARERAQAAEAMDLERARAAEAQRLAVRDAVVGLAEEFERRMTALTPPAPEPTSEDRPPERSWWRG